jgi:hypothetical protein
MIEVVQAFDRTPIARLEAGRPDPARLVKAATAIAPSRRVAA